MNSEQEKTLLETVSIISDTVFNFRETLDVTIDNIRDLERLHYEIQRIFEVGQIGVMVNGSLSTMCHGRYVMNSDPHSYVSMKKAVDSPLITNGGGL